MVNLALISGCLALIWTAAQQFQINKICEKCPYHPSNQKEKIKEFSPPQTNPYQV